MWLVSLILGADRRRQVKALAIQSPEGAELLAVLTPDLAPRNRRAAERALLAAQADGDVDRRPLGDDALWTLRH